jgi:hypothetical protein
MAKGKQTFAQEENPRFKTIRRIGRDPSVFKLRGASQKPELHLRNLCIKYAFRCSRFDARGGVDPGDCNLLPWVKAAVLIQLPKGD